MQGFSEVQASYNKTYRGRLGLYSEEIPPEERHIFENNKAIIFASFDLEVYLTGLDPNPANCKLTRNIVRSTREFVDRTGERRVTGAAGPDPFGEVHMKRDARSGRIWVWDAPGLSYPATNASNSLASYRHKGRYRLNVDGGNEHAHIEYTIESYAELDEIGGIATKTGPTITVHEVDGIAD